LGLWIEILPQTILENLDIIALLIVGFLVERKFVGRMTAFSNAVAVNLLVLRMTDPHWLLRLYADVGAVIGLVCLISYASYIEYAHRNHVDPPNEFPYHLYGRWYDAMWWYNSVIVALFILLSGAINGLVQIVPDLPISLI
jgi:hypothetical protein